MIRVRLAQLLADLQYRQTLLLELAVETSRDLRRFNALANPDFVIPKLPPGGDMSFAPGQEASQQEASTSISMYCSRVTRGTFSSNNWLLQRERYHRSV